MSKRILSKINFKLNLQFEQCDLVHPPSLSYVLASNDTNGDANQKVNLMMPWQILTYQLTLSQPGGRLCPHITTCNPRFSYLHGHPRGFFGYQFQIKFTIWTVWLDPSSFTYVALHQQWHQWRCKSKGQVDDAMGVQEDSLTKIKFTIWTVWLGPSSFTSLLASDDVNGDAAANAHPMQRDSARFGHSVEIFFVIKVPTG